MTSTTVLVLDPGDRLAAACEPALKHFGAGHWRVTTGPNELLETLHQENQAIPLVLLGPDADEPIGLAQRIAAVDGDIGIVLVCESAHFSSTRTAARFSPFLSRGLEIVDLAAAGSLPAVLRQGVQRARQRRMHQRVVQAAQTQQRSLSPGRPNLRRSYNQLLDAAPIGIMLLSGEHKLISINRHALELLGTREQEVIGRDAQAAFASSVRGDVQALFAMKLDAGVAHRFIHWPIREGLERVLDLRLCASDDDAQDGFIMTLQDFSEHRRLEAQLRQAQKMEAVGTLAGGVAHDFNNLLTPILSYVDLITRQVEDAKVLSMLERIGSAAERARKLVEQLLSYSGQAEPALELVRLEDIVVDVIRLLEPLGNEHLSILSTLPAEEPPPLQLDVNQMHQVLMNLCMNAIHAMDGAGQLELQILGPSHRQFSDVRAHWVEGRFVSLCVRDSGSGIPAEIRQKVFEPFFSTRRGGEGTGLGLAVVLGIVTEHGGYLELQCPDSGGTCILVHFPAPA